MYNVPKHFKNIILIGMPGCGKTSFGHSYAIYSKRHFLDFEKYFSYAMQKNKVTHLISEELQQQEELILKKLERRQNHVISLNSATLYREEHFNFAHRLGLIVFLDAPIPVLSKRILSDKKYNLKKRPVFDHLNSKVEIEEELDILWQERKKFYQRAYIHLNTEFGNIDNLKLQLGLYEKKNMQRETWQKNNISHQGL